VSFAVANATGLVALAIEGQATRNLNDLTSRLIALCGAQI
jgi:hypothetical protein